MSPPIAAVPSAPPIQAISPIAASASVDFRAAPPIVARQPAEPSGDDGYAMRVVAWLERHKAYPAALTRERRDATALVRFHIDHRGRVDEVVLVRTSGIPWLDRLALKQVRDAAPFPRPPKGLDAARRSFEVPMRYRARG